MTTKEKFLGSSVGRGRLRAGADFDSIRIEPLQLASRRVKKSCSPGVAIKLITRKIYDFPQFDERRIGRLALHRPLCLSGGRTCRSSAASVGVRFSNRVDRFQVTRLAECSALLLSETGAYEIRVLAGGHLPVTK